MIDKGIVFNSKEKISAKAFEKYFNSSFSKKGTLLMSFKLTVGRVSILGVDAVHNEAIISINPYYGKNNQIRNFLYYTLGIIVNYTDKTDAIKGSTLNKEKLSKMLVPLPPLEEQQRIVDKINRFNEIIINLI